LSWLLFMDESGHDHKSMPYEVRGGVALHARVLWSFVQDWQNCERSCYGALLAQYKKELKGAKLLDKDRFKWSRQKGLMGDAERQRLCRGFLTKGLEKKAPTQDEFTAYGQASIKMATCVFELLEKHGAVLFASAIPREVLRPATFEAERFLRKDHVFLLERFYYFLEQKKEDGLLVMDEVEKEEDRGFVRKLEAYFMRTAPGQKRSHLIAPTPFFVSSDMTYPVQAADLCIYCINWGFRIPKAMTAVTRHEIDSLFSSKLEKLQWVGKCVKAGDSWRSEQTSYGIIYVPDPYEPRK